MNIIYFLISFSFLILAMSVHEFAHGWVAYKLGDTTAKNSGRLTLNPLAHIDPIGTLLLPLILFITTRGQFVFGAAKPVPINYWALRNPRRGIIWIGLSGPGANFIFAILLSIALKLLGPSELISFIFTSLISINVILGVFNLLPIPPLDGSRVLMGLLPPELSSRYASFESHGFIVIMLLAALGVLDIIVWPIVRNILGVLLI